MSWASVYLKYISRFQYGDSLPSDERLRKGPIPVYGSNGPYAEFSEANTEAPVIIVGRKGSYGKINWSKQKVYASDTTFFVDSNSTNHHLRWLFYVLQALNLDEGSNEAAVPGLNRETAYQKRVLVPPKPTQRAIADYLDEKTAVIDQLITAKECLLKLLDEKRRALITHAVTRGLDATVPLRDSGVEWIGQRPTHWKNVKIGFVANVFNGTTPSRIKSEYWENGTIPWISSGKVNDYIVETPSELITEVAQKECSLSLVPKGSVIMGMIGQGRTRGMTARLAIDTYINQNLAAIVPKSNLVGEFLHYVLIAFYDHIRELGRGGNQDALNTQIISSFVIPLPSLTEQKQIANFINSEISKIDNLSNALDKLQILLEERRTALIATAVSGQHPVAYQS